MQEQVKSKKVTGTLIEISNQPIFELYPDKLDLVLTQSNAESQLLMYEMINSAFIDNKVCIYYMLYYTDKPLKQRRVLKLARYPNILYEEFFMISMMGIKDEKIVDKLIYCFDKNLINNSHDFYHYRNKYDNLSIINSPLTLVKRL